MRLKHRVTRLARVLGQHGQVTYEEMAAAHQRIGESAIAKVEAVLAGLPIPEMDPVEYQRNVDIIERWERQQGIPRESEEVVKERLLQKMEGLAVTPSLITELRRVNAERFAQ